MVMHLGGTDIIIQNRQKVVKSLKFIKPEKNLFQAYVIIEYLQPEDITRIK